MRTVLGILRSTAGFFIGMRFICAMAEGLGGLGSAIVWRTRQPRFEKARVRQG